VNRSNLIVYTKYWRNPETIVESGHHVASERDRDDIVRVKEAMNLPCPFIFASPRL
jgi:hypothetical protein